MKNESGKLVDRTVPEKVSRMHKMLHGILGCLQQIVDLLFVLVKRLDVLIDVIVRWPNGVSPISSYADVVELVQKVRYDDALKMRSIPKAIQYIRFNANEASPYYKQCLEARGCVKKLAKKRIDGEEKAWRSIAKMAQPNYVKKRRRSRNAPPGPVPIPDASWALGISPPRGAGFGNNCFPG